MWFHWKTFRQVYQLKVVYMISFKTISVFFIRPLGKRVVCIRKRVHVSGSPSVVLVMVQLTCKVWFKEKLL